MPTHLLLLQIIHDYQHKGVNNDFLVRTGDSLAILYNDRSPMENHHLVSDGIIGGAEVRHSMVNNR